MKFQPEAPGGGVNVISRHAPGAVWVGSTAYTRSIVLPWEGAVQAWDVPSFDALTAAHFGRIAALAPEVVLFGSGSRIRFPHPSLLRALIERRIGVETMDTPAACRTYNVLVGEMRSVVAALLIEPAPGDGSTKVADL